MIGSVVFVYALVLHTNIVVDSETDLHLLLRLLGALAGGVRLVETLVRRVNLARWDELVAISRRQVQVLLLREFVDSLLDLLFLILDQRLVDLLKLLKKGLLLFLQFHDVVDLRLLCGNARCQVLHAIFLALHVALGEIESTLVLRFRLL